MRRLSPRNRENFVHFSLIFTGMRELPLGIPDRDEVEDVATETGDEIFRIGTVSFV